MTLILLKNETYKVKHKNYNRTINFFWDGIYRNGLLGIAPHQDVRITINSYITFEELDVIVSKYDNNGKQLSSAVGRITKANLLSILDE